MPANLNKVFLIGNLTRDPELRYLPSGQAVTNFTVAMNRAYVAANGEKKQETSFVRVITWGHLAEVCNEYLRKGRSVFVEGRLQSRSWTGQDGVKRNSLEVVAQSVQFLGSVPARSATQPTTPSPEEETIIDNSFDKGKKENSINISDEELSPDEEVPF